MLKYEKYIKAWRFRIVQSTIKTKKLDGANDELGTKLWQKFVNNEE